MAQPFKPSPLARRLMGLLRLSVATDDGQSLAAISHRLPIKLQGSAATRTFTVYLSPDSKGTFLVTCRELPEVTALGENEEEALEMAEAAILEALAARRGSSDPRH